MKVTLQAVWEEHGTLFALETGMLFALVTGIEQVVSSKLLGVTFSHNLEFDEHVLRIV